MSESTADARRNISEWEARLSMSWPMTAELTRDALNALNIPAGRLTELLLRYMGEHEDEHALARMLATENTDVDLDAWPFDCIEWERAAASLRADGVRCVNGGYWFDGGQHELYARPLDELDELVRAQ